MSEDEKIKVINFIQDFGCCRESHLQILFNRPNDNFKAILSHNVVSKKGDIYIYNNTEIKMKVIYALDVLCKYKKRIKYYHKGFDPVFITFLSKSNELYNIIVSDKKNEKGVVKVIQNNSPIIPSADKFILLFEDEECLKEIQCDTEYAYCIYPEMRIVNKRKCSS